jgi:lysophospholipase L1-like esterase
MLFKMLGMERGYSMLSDDLAHPRQVFITQSRVLVGKVEELFFKYLESLNVGSSGYQNAFQRMRNCDVDDGFHLNENDNEEWRNDLPQKYSELEDKHFPLFITFDAVSFVRIECSLS